MHYPLINWAHINCLVHINVQQLTMNDIYVKLTRQVIIFLKGFMFSDCSLLKLSSGEFFLKSWYQRSNENWTGDIEYPFGERKLFSGVIQVSSTDLLYDLCYHRHQALSSPFGRYIFKHGQNFFQISCDCLVRQLFI